MFIFFERRLSMSNMTDVSAGLRNMMKSRKLTISELADESNIPEDTIKSIRSGKTRNPGIQTIIRLADAMQCSIDELIGHKSTSTEELEFFSSWKKLDQHGRKLVQAITDIEVSNCHEISHQKRFISCIVSSSNLSDGFIYDSFYIQTIEIPANSFPNADFCIYINTDSLSPIYFKGDILAIEKRFPHNGEIAIFIHHNIGYIRRYEIQKEKEQLLPLLPACKTLESKQLSEYVCFGTILGIVKFSPSENSRHHDADSMIQYIKPNL